MSKKKGNVVGRLAAGILLCLLAVTITTGVRRARAFGKSAAAPAAPVAAATPAAPASVLQGGRWSSLIQMKDVPVHLSLLPDGRLL
jgi:hypothetical protein